MSNFQTALHKLTDHPDKNLIEYLTEYCVNNQSISNSLADVIFLRLTERNLPPTYKLSIFYLMDNIMKRSRDAFVLLFQERMERTYQHLFQEMTDGHRAKLDKLFGFWEERNFFHRNLLKQMRDLINRLLPIAPVSQLDTIIKLVPNVDQIFVSRRVMPPSRPDHEPHIDSNVYAREVDLNPRHEEFQRGREVYSSSIKRTNEGMDTNVRFPKRGRESNLHFNQDPRGHFPSNSFRGRDVSSFSRPEDKLIRFEMTKLLDAMLNEIPGGQTSLSLDDLHIENPALFQQLFLQAETIISNKNRDSFKPEKSLIQNSFSKIDSISQNTTRSVNSPILQTSPIQFSPIEGGKAHPPRFTFGFIGQGPVPVNLSRVDVLIHHLNDIAESYGSSDFKVSSMSKNLSSRLKFHSTDQVFNLPSILFGPLPLEPSAEFMKQIRVKQDVVGPSKIPVPIFRSEDLHLRPGVAVQKLYLGYPTVNLLAEDGQRFSKIDEYKQHNDLLIEAKIKRKNLIKEGKNVDERKFQSWYCLVSRWTKTGASSKKTSAAMKATLEDAQTPAATEEYIVPADEHFVRCPISKEIFEKIWDEDEGEFMYRNAVKVMVTETANKALYDIGQPTSEAGVHYLIVRKPLIMDGWLSSGQAATLNETVQRYQFMGGRGHELITRVKNAAGYDEDGDDIFVLLDHVVN